MTAPAWMPFYVADYLADTGHLTATEHGVYLLLIFQYWRNGGLPAEDHKLARIGRVTLEEWEAMRVTIGAFFGEGWRHKRIERELAEARDLLAKRSAAGQAGASARHGKRMANAVQTHAIDPSNAVQTQVPSPSPSPSQREKTTTNLTPTEQNSGALPASLVSPTDAATGGEIIEITPALKANRLVRAS